MKKTILSVMMALFLLLGSTVSSFTPLAVTASAAASQAEIDQLKSDIQLLDNHVSRKSYISTGKSTNRYNVTCALQRTLNLLYNAGLSVDGGYGRLSVAAVKNVQRAAGLWVDGIFGSGTLRVVKAKAEEYIAANTVSTNAYFESMVVPSSIKYGNSFNLNGTVRSVGSPIWYITGQIIDNSTNRSVAYESERVGGYEYNIRKGKINTNLRFGSLNEGNYALVYYVTTMDGHNYSQAYSFTVYQAVSNITTTSSNGYKLIEAARADKDKNYASMGFSRNSNWCAKSVGLWLKTIGIDLGSTPVVNDVVERLVAWGYSAEAYVFRDTRNKFTNDNLNKLYGAAKATEIEDRYSVEPKPGDIICFRWVDSPYENYSHIGIVVDYNPSTRQITTIEGNTGSSNPNYSLVMERTRDFDNQVVALVRLK